MQSSKPRQGAYFTLLWIGNGDRESQPLNLSTTRNFKRKVFIWKTRVISLHTALHFIYVLTLSEISKKSSFDRSNVFLDRLKYSTNPFWSFWMTQSILDSCSIDRKANLIDRKEFSIDRKTEEIHHKVSGWLDRFSIPIWSIKRQIWLVERNSQSDENCETDFFQIFLVTVFWHFTWTKHSFLIISE